MVPGSVTARPWVGAVHVHSAYSHDGRDSLEQLRTVALSRGLRFVALSDHAEDFDAARFATFAERCAELSDDELLLIPGLEYRFAGYRGLHLLALGLGQWIAPPPPTPEAFAEQARAVAAFTLLAHPGLAGYAVPLAVAQSIDAVEVWNAAYNTRYMPDPRAIRLLRVLRRTRPEVVGVAGLDQHDARNDRETRVVLGVASRDPLGELRAGRFRNRGRTMTFGPYGDWLPGVLAGLSILRAGFDVVEHVQERVARQRAHHTSRNSAGE